MQQAEQQRLPDAAAPAEPLPFWALGRTGKSQWWRYLLSPPLIVVCWFLCVILILLAFAPFYGWDVPPDVNDWRTALLYDAIASFAVLTLGLGASALSAWLVVVIVHKRTWRSLVTGRERFDWRAFAISTMVVFALWAMLMAISLPFGTDEWDLAPDLWAFAIALPFILSLVPLQVLGEEVLFRGYLLQLVGRFCRIKAIVVLAPATLFWALHLYNDEAQVGGLSAILSYAVFSLYATYLVVKTNGLEHAIGIHLGGNFVAFTLAGDPQVWYPMPTLVIFTEETDYFFSFLAEVTTLALHYWIVFHLLPRWWPAKKGEPALTP